MRIFCDIDGVLCDSEHREHYFKEGKYISYYDEKEMDKDTTISSGINLLDMLQSQAWNEVILVTARSESVREYTENWIKHQRLHKQPKLIMRPVGNKQSQVSFKLKAIDEYRKNNIKYYQEMFIDDNEQIIKTVNQYFPEMTTLLFKKGKSELLSRIMQIES